MQGENITPLNESQQHDYTTDNDSNRSEESDDFLTDSSSRSSVSIKDSNTIETSLQNNDGNNQEVQPDTSINPQIEQTPPTEETSVNPQSRIEQTQVKPPYEESFMGDSEGRSKDDDSSSFISGTEASENQTTRQNQAEPVLQQQSQIIENDQILPDSNTSVAEIRAEQEYNIPVVKMKIIEKLKKMKLRHRKEVNLPNF